MIHSERGKTFNIPSNIFNQDNFFVSFSRIGSVIKEGFSNPDSANAIGDNKFASVMKSYSEMVERRAIMMGGLKQKNELVNTFDLLKEEPSVLPYHFTTYSLRHDFPIDTTGSAAHFDSKVAIQNALSELLEKNSLFLFWYGNLGYKIADNPLQNNQYWQFIIRSGYQIAQFFNNYFSPYYNVLTIIQMEGTIISAGLGFHSNFIYAQKKSLKECFLLFYQNESLDIVNKMINQEGNDNYFEHRQAIEKLSNYPEFKVRQITKMTKNKNVSLQGLIDACPNWVKDLHLIYLKQEFDSRLICVKVFSKSLYNHVPIKRYLNLRNDINKNTIKLSQDNLSNQPDCIFV
ncbi:hypothetical protein GCM10007063_32470 [Lentibacillus kapialis]|uniref:YcaO domain-containing protein n=1 Tax=Lentibacillus kapialis TaxID=340214 RepID=A0A917V112_9BACI|nr:YcaO-like family protein [Lentibacillus kapialis]GGK07438.1 hypothetical protein GCM10007063_32470 [Lentibacillus kapialis]